MEVEVSSETLVDLYEFSRCHDSENYSLNNGDPTIHIQVSIHAFVQTSETSGLSRQCIGRGITQTTLEPGAVAVGDQLHAPPALLQEKGPCTHFTVG